MTSAGEAEYLSPLPVDFDDQGHNPLKCLRFLHIVNSQAIIVIRSRCSIINSLD